jgi:hypothetical protein
MIYISLIENPPLAFRGFRGKSIHGGQFRDKGPAMLSCFVQRLLFPDSLDPFGIPESFFFDRERDSFL